MKKFYVFTLSFACLLNSLSAEIVNIEVKSNQFVPSTTNVTVGDVIHFANTGGFHNVTSALTVIPVGAPTMNSGGPSGNPWEYDYTITLPGVYHYYCEVHSSDGITGMIGTLNATGSTPVVFKNFTVVPMSNKKPLVGWTTLTESNVDYFSLRSSYDGQNFTEVAKIAAKGNSNAEQSYSYTDLSISNKNRYIYYELVIRDRDGKETFSKIIMFKNTQASLSLITQLGPNPVKLHDHVMIQYNSEKVGKLKAYVYDAAGKLATKTDMESVPGLNNGHLHMCGFASGIYTVVFSLDGIKETRKIVVE